MPDTCPPMCALDHGDHSPRFCGASRALNNGGGHAVCTRPSAHCGPHFDRVLTGRGWLDTNNR